MQVAIEVAISNDLTSTDKGLLLERLGRDVLEAMGFEVVSQVRLAGMEVDLLARHKAGGEKIFVECKAYREPFAADVITKLLGNVELKKAWSGWLITTANLNKDGKAIQIEWEQQSQDERRKRCFYAPERIVELLVSSGRVCDPRMLKRPADRRYSEDNCLLITNHGQFWAVPLINVAAGVPYAVVLFDAKTGESVSDLQLIEAVSQTDTSLHELEWIAPGSSLDTPRVSTLTDQAQSIFTVLSGNNWADYRPARPQDFVGRKNLQRDIFGFLDSVRIGHSATRIVAIKSPSGWGKSSVLLKLIDHCRNVRNRGKYFMYAVDARAATSTRYG